MKNAIEKIKKSFSLDLVLEYLFARIRWSTWDYEALVLQNDAYNMYKVYFDKIGEDFAWGRLFDNFVTFSY